MRGKVKRETKVFTSVFMVLLATFSVFVVASIPTDKNIGIISPSSVDQGIEKYGSTCVSTTGDFRGRETPAHKGIWETIECDHNVLTNEGASAIKEILGNGVTAYSAFDVIAIGNGTAPVAGDTTLDNEWTANNLSRAQGTYTSIGNANWTIVYTFTATTVDDMYVNTTGLFNQTTVAGDAMLAGNSFSDAILDGSTNDELKVNWSNGVS